MWTRNLAAALILAAAIPPGAARNQLPALYEIGSRETKTWNTYEEGTAPYKWWLATTTDAPSTSAGTHKEGSTASSGNALVSMVNNWNVQPEVGQPARAKQEEDVSVDIHNHGSGQSLGQLTETVRHALKTGMSKLAVAGDTTIPGQDEVGAEDEYAATDEEVVEDEELVENDPIAEDDVVPETAGYSEKEEAPEIEEVPEDEAPLATGDEPTPSHSEVIPSEWAGNAHDGTHVKGDHKKAKGRKHKGQHVATAGKEQVSAIHASETRVEATEDECKADDTVPAKGQMQHAATVTMTVYASAPTPGAGGKQKQNQIEDEFVESEGEGEGENNPAPQVEEMQEGPVQTEDEKELPDNDEFEDMPKGREPGEEPQEESEDDATSGKGELDDCKNMSNLMSTLPAQDDCHGKVPPTVRSLNSRRLEYRGDFRRVQVAARYGSRRHDWWL
ncbi:hypothetical protein QFC22_003304 [Naganishia vaughanmartiniae]|uniref:Uncharacterized protein n=1 Tax=Naganishia vaughanmartiniae TaxID=1424756 RepID=A0ACC2X890_9TREE|nr:hypothetical protein QFC22_003304 [Naganishia vaughanmartiniae]